MSERVESVNASQSPFDIVKVYEDQNEDGTSRPIGLQRKHRDEIDLYFTNRIIPGSFVFAILRDSIGEVVRATHSHREFEGLLAAFRYCSERDISRLIWGSAQAVENHLRGKG